MRIDLSNPVYQETLKTLFTSSLKEAGLHQRSSANSLFQPKIIETDTPDGKEYTLEFNQYGLFLDKGVKGVKGGLASGSPYKMKSKGIFTALSGKMNNRNIGAIYWYGIRPYPWVETFLDRVERVFSERLEEDLVNQIIEVPTEIGPATLKITL